MRDRAVWVKENHTSVPAGRAGKLGDREPEARRRPAPGKGLPDGPFTADFSTAVMEVPETEERLGNCQRSFHSGPDPLAFPLPVIGHNPLTRTFACLHRTRRLPAS